MIKVGDSLPAATLMEYSEVEGNGCSIGPNPVDVTKASAGKTIALFALPGAFVLMLATRRRGGMGEPAAVPLALLVSAVFSLVVLPAQNLVSRSMEAEADWKALQTTRDPAAARGLFEEFATTSLGDPSPPTWAYLMLQTHPTLAQRVAMANAWQARNRR